MKTRDGRKTRARGLLLLLACLLLGVAGCERGDPDRWSDEELQERVRGKPTNYKPGDLVPMRVGLLNYTDEFMGNVYVERSWAADSHKHSYTTGAGSAVAPAFYDPDYKIVVRWRPESLYRKDKTAYLQREIVPEPPQKDELGRMTYLWVTFFPDGEVKLYPTWVSPGSPDFPDGLRNPKDVCEEQYPDERERCYKPVPSWHKKQEDGEESESNSVEAQEAQDS